MGNDDNMFGLGAGEDELTEGEKKQVEKSKNTRWVKNWFFKNVDKIVLSAIGIICTGIGLMISSRLEISESLTIGPTFILLVLWAILSIRIIKEDQQGVVVKFGKPDESQLYESGPMFLWRFLGYRLERFPTDLYEIDFPELKVYSKKGTYGKGDNEKDCEAIALNIDYAFYVWFPRDIKRMIKIIKSGIGSLREEKKFKEKIIKLFKSATEGAYRTAAGNITWMLAIEKEGREKLKTGVEEIMAETNSVWERAGLGPEDITLTTNSVEPLDLKLKEAMALPDTERKKLEAAGPMAERRIKEIGAMGKAKKELEKNGILGDEATRIVDERDRQRTIQEGGGKIDEHIVNSKGDGGSGILSFGEIAKLMAKLAVSSGLIKGGKTSTEKKDSEETEEDAIEWLESLK